MKIRFSLMLLFLIVHSTVSYANPANVLESIAAAIQAGNARQLAQHFDQNVDITVYNKEEMYSKTQAEMVIKDFFAKNAPVSFKIIHKGASSQGSEYAIGTLVTAVGTFRTYIYIKQKGTTYLIQEIRFEKD
jgi:hypothetical protein